MFITEELANRFGAVPVNGEKHGSNTLWAKNPLSEQEKEELAFLVGEEFELIIVGDDQFNEAFINAYQKGPDAKRNVPEKSRIKPHSGFSESETRKFSHSGSVVQQINDIVETAIQKKASDIHLEPYENDFRVRYRIDGTLILFGHLESRNKEAFISRLKILSELDIAEKRRPQDGKIIFKTGEKAYDLRLSILPTVYGEKAVLRILDKQDVQLELDKLGFNAEAEVHFRKAIQNPFGMILVTGPTGSGKTTTLYAALQQLNREGVNITTIEDPVEYNIPGINQTQVRSDIGLTFSKALRSFLRQDPDIIMVGEIRDTETAQIATRAALTGHLVLSTIHTNDAPSTVSRLLDMGVEPYLIASSLRMVLAQRLVRKICKNCKQPADYDTSVMNGLGVADWDYPIYEGKGCTHCNFTGYSGRVALFETLPVENNLADQIARGTTTMEIKKGMKVLGIKDLREAGLIKIKEGITTPEEVLKQAIFQ